MRTTKAWVRYGWFLSVAGILFLHNATTSFAESVGITSEKVIDLADVEWGPAGEGGRGFPKGVQTAPQGIDSVTGGITYYAKFPAGSHYALHWHSHDEYVVVVSGKLEIQLGEESHSLEVGSYIVIPGALNHSWTVPAEGNEAIILVRRAGPADFHFVSEQ